MDTQQKKQKQRDPRTLVIMALWGAGKLDDQTLSKERMQTFKSQPFSTWPKEMQEELAPFGAEMIV